MQLASTGFEPRPDH